VENGILQALAWPAASLIALTALALVLSHNWRWSILLLSVQYLGVFLLSLQSWEVELAVVKLVAGWMASAVLGIAINEANSAGESWQETEAAWPSGRVFRLLASALVVMLVISLSPGVTNWAPSISLAQAAGGVMLISMGILHLGLTAQPMRVATGLLTILAGFEIIYSTVESSTLLAGLLAAVHLGVALATAYIILAPTLEQDV
jgi:hypothetical protein